MKTINTSLGPLSPDQLVVKVMLRAFINEGALFGALKGLSEADRPKFLELSHWVTERLVLSEKYRGKILALVRCDDKFPPKVENPNVATEPGQFRQLLERIKGKNLRITFKEAAGVTAINLFFGMAISEMFVISRADEMHLRVVAMSGRWEDISRTVEVVPINFCSDNVNWFLGRLSGSIEKLELV